MKIRERKGPSQGVIQHTDSHERGPCASKFEDRSSRIRQQFYRLGNSAKTTDIPMSGPVVKKNTSH